MILNFSSQPLEAVKVAKLSLFNRSLMSMASSCNIGPSVNRGGGYGLEIPVLYHFLGPAKATDWLKRKLETVEKEIECNVSKCLK